jgi:hypothetical protein
MPRRMNFNRRLTWLLTAVLVDKASQLRGITPQEIIQVKNKRLPAHTRFGIMWVMRQLDVVLVDICEQTGMGDYSSIIYGLNVAKRLRDEDPEFRDYTNKLLKFAANMRPLADGAVIEDAETDAEAA